MPVTLLCTQYLYAQFDTLPLIYVLLAMKSTKVQNPRRISPIMRGYWPRGVAVIPGQFPL